MAMPGALGCSEATMAALLRFDPRSRELRLSAAAGGAQSESVFASAANALLELLEAVSEENPLLVVIDDAHWLDELSSEVLADLIAHIDRTRAVLLITARADFPSRAAIAMASENLRTHELSPLCNSDARSLLENLVAMERGGLDESTVRRYIDLAEGNPGALHELSVFWTQYGEAPGVPESLKQSVAKRIASLSEPARHLLHASVLLGTLSTIARLELALALPQVEMLRAIQELQSAGVLGDKSGAIEPRHELIIGEFATISAGHASQYLHRRIGLALRVDVDAGAPDSIVLACALHFIAASDWQSALQVLERRSTVLLDGNRPQEAANLWTQALNLCTSRAQSSDVKERLIPIVHALGDMSAVKRLAAEVAQSRSTEQDQAGDTDTPNVHVLDAGLHTGADSHSLYATAFEILNDARRSDAQRTQAGVSALVIAGSLFDRQLIFEAHDCLQKIGARARPISVDSVVIELIYNCDIGDLDVAVAAGARLVELTRESGCLADLAKSLRYSAKPLRWVGEFEAARDALVESFEIGQRLDSVSMAMLSAELIATTYLEQGDLEAARSWLSRGLALSDSTCVPHRHLALSYVAAVVALLAGDITPAVRVAEQAHSAITRGRSVDQFAYSVTGLRMLLEATRRGRQEVELATSFLPLFYARQGFGDQDFHAYCAQVALTGLGRHSEARRVVTEYVEFHRRERYPVPSYLNSSDVTGSSARGRS